MDSAGLAGLVDAGGVVVLTGAGMSTDSGIPDYRGTGGVRRRRGQIQGPDFRASPSTRQRYWARSMVGWPAVAAAQPNGAHRAVAALERAGRVDRVLTQNVDGLHDAAGSRAVVDLHGRLARVLCLACGARSSRDQLQQRLLEANPRHLRSVGPLAPDGDVDLPVGLVERFVVVGCERCDGVLIPDVVFFGDSVPRERVAVCTDAVAEARALLVLGSSLAVMSGYRFVLQARRAGIPVAVVNRGPTRADTTGPLAVRLDAGLAETLGALLDQLGITDGAAGSVPDVGSHRWSPPPTAMVRGAAVSVRAAG